MFQGLRLRSFIFLLMPFIVTPSSSYTMPTLVFREEPLDVKSLVAPMYKTHKSTVNQSYKWRMDNLRKLRKIHTDHILEWQEALLKDTGKQPVEAQILEICLDLAEIDYFLSNLKSFMKPKQVSSAGYNVISFSQIEQRPLRPPAVLVIGACNYPLQLTLVVAAGAIAAGNPVVLKPSELTPAVSNLLAKLCAQYFDEGTLRVVEGGKEVVTELLKHEWGTVFFTGSERVGRIVAEAAAKTLSPIVLELGGKSPVYVDEDAPNLAMVASRIIWGKTLNSGQTCVCPDYLVVHEKHKDRLVQELEKEIVKQFGTDVQNSEIGRFVQESHAERVLELIKESERAGAQVIGGTSKCDTKDKFIYPTLIVDPPLGSRVLNEEIFGPVLPIVTVKSRQEAKNLINAMHGIPLSMYIFTSKQSVFRDMICHCPSGAVLRNDVMVHFPNPHLPAGGLGTSGIGKYHGIHSWNTFTHAQSQVYRPIYPFADFGGIRRHPFKGIKEKVILLMMNVPFIPPLHPRKVIVSGAVICTVLAVPTLRFGLANFLAIVVDWLRSM